ncbi:MAG: AAA family ATPase [Lewinella sp.]
MKLLRIGIRNLNSLSGDQSVDFLEEPLASSGLYAIVGPTGAGKTSILDAITLALYGRTERDRYGNEVMSHGTGDCFAEVEFSNDHGRYLSRWERRRARSKADGKLQTAERSLSEWNEVAGEYQPVDNADGLRGVNERTEEILGLDYGRFVRSVMLTQGQFARFLESDVSERSGVLERITGTEIYSQISEAAFLRHKLANDDYLALKNQLELQPPLSTEDRKVLADQLKQAGQTSLYLRPRLKSSREALESHRRHTEQTALLETEQKQVAALETEWVSMTPKRNALSASLRLQPLRDPLAKMDGLKKSKATVAAQLAAAEATLKTLEPAVKRTLDAVKAATLKLEKHLAERPSKLQTLEQAEALERQIAELQGAGNKEKARLAELEKEAEELRLKQTATERELATLRQKTGNAEPATLEAELAALETQQPKLDERVHMLKAWTLYQTATGKLEGANAALNKANQVQVAATEARLVAQKSQQLAEETCALREKDLRRKEQTQNLDHLRSTLPEGEACPVCGATEHPALVDFEPVEDAEISLARRDVELARKTLEEAKAELALKNKAVQNAASVFAGAEATVTGLSEQVAGLLPPGEPPVLPDLAAALKTAAKQLETATGRLKTLRQLRGDLQRMVSIQQSLAMYATHQGKVSADLKALKASSLVTVEGLKELRLKKDGLIGAYTVQKCREMLAAHDKKLQGQTDSSRAEADRIGQQKTAAETTRNARRDDLKLVEEQMKTLSDKLDALLAGVDFSDLPEGCRELLPLEEEEALRKELTEKEQALKVCRARVEQTMARRAELSAIVKELPPVEQLTADLAKDEVSYAENEQLVGALKGEITRDDERRAAAQAISTQLQASEKELYRWAALNNLIGQKDGTKFRRYAQTLTLQRLVEAGNYHLNSISGRYQMRHKAAVRLDKEALELEIIDTFQNDNRRPTSTLSGGETFIVSLALALGLSDLAAGKQVIQSLFIDEGFGTLDEKILDQAMTTLEQLQAQGKTIGLISHVKELRERIHCQIQLEPVGDGFSKISVIGG